MKFFVSFIAIFYFLGNALAQNEVEVLRFTQQQITGTARNLSMGGANTSLGGEISALNFNPAGLGMFTRDELTLTPSLTIKANTSSHYGNDVYNSKPKLGIENIGYAKVVFPKNKVIKNFNYALAHSKNLFFDEVIEIEGVNPESSLADAFYNMLQLKGAFNPNNPPSNYPFSADMAWQTFLLDTFQNQYVTAITSYNNLQYKKVTRQGSSSNLTLSGAANLNYKWYLGGSINIQSVDFTEASEYSETTNELDTNAIIDGFLFEEYLSTQGTGVALKIGSIYRISDMFRVSAAFHTPTFISLVDNWESYMITRFKNFSDIDYQSPQGSFRYRMLTPLKALFGATVVFNKLGLITIDYEYVDYPSAKYSTRNNSYNYNTENERIANVLKPTGNVKIGTEWRFGPMAYRAGYAIFGNPYQDGYSANQGYTTFSLGTGFRKENFFIDAAFQSINFNTSNYVLYNPELAPISLTKVESTNLRINFTIGIKY